MRSHRTPRTRGSNRFVPRVEALEDRFLLACEVAVDGATLRITGDRGKNQITILDNGTDLDGNIELVCDRVAQTFPDRTLTDIEVATGGGKDSVTYRLPDPLIGSRRVSVSLGGGKDNFLGSLAGGVGSGGDLRIRVEGGSGNDTLRVSNPAGVGNGARYAATLRGEDGRDRILSSFQGVARSGAEVTLTAEGGAGRDRVDAEFFFSFDSRGSLVARLLGEGDNDRLILRGTAGTATSIDVLIDGGGGSEDFCASPPGSVRVRNCEIGQFLR